MDGRGQTAQVVAQVRGLVSGPLPVPAITVARQCLLDWLGVTLAGTGEVVVDLLVGEMITTGGAGEAGLIGRPERAPAAIAALVNGAAGHALDYDDTHTAMSGHPTAPVAPAALAMAERLGASGSDLLAALIAGIEIECRVGLLVNPSHYEAGWHATGTLGAIGAAAACAYLLGLDDDGWASAIGLAATQSAGLKAVFGSMAKPFHAGKAAHSGLMAAALTASGFTSHPAILEAPQGFGATFAGHLRSENTLDDLADRYLVLDTLFKYHAACYLTHSAIDAVGRLRNEEAVKADDVERAEVHVHRSCLAVCAIPEPRTGLEGKFSLTTSVAMALLGDDTADPRSFTDGRMAETDLVALRDRVTVVPDGPGPATQSTVIIETAERTVSATVDTGCPDDDLERQGQRLAAKFMALTGPVLGEGAARSLVDLVNTIESGHAAEIVEASL